MYVCVYACMQGPLANQELRQRQCQEACNKIYFYASSYRLVSILSFPWLHCFYFRWNSLDSSVSSWTKRLTGSFSWDGDQIAKTKQMKQLKLKSELKSHTRAGRYKRQYRGFSRRPCWRAETMKSFAWKTVLLLSSNMAAMTSHENTLFTCAFFCWSCHRRPRMFWHGLTWSNFSFHVWCVFFSFLQGFVFSFFFFLFKVLFCFFVLKLRLGTINVSHWREKHVRKFPRFFRWRIFAFFFPRGRQPPLRRACFAKQTFLEFYTLWLCR